MDQVVPWQGLIALIEPHYPKGEAGRPAYVHVTPEVFQLEDDDIQRLAEGTIEAVAGLMECIRGCRAAVASRLSDAISDAVVHQVVGETGFLGQDARHPQHKLLAHFLTNPDYLEVGADDLED